MISGNLFHNPVSEDKRKYMKILKITVILSCLLILTGCDKQVGENGVIEDSVTGERLQNVTVKMISSQGSRTDTSDSNGYFSVIKNFSCGIGNCQTNFQIEFIKEDYDTLSISQSYYSSDLAHFVNEEKRDTLIIKLKHKD